MSEFDKTEVYRLRRKKRKQKILIKRILFFSLSLILLVGIILCGIGIYRAIFPSNPQNSISNSNGIPQKVRTAMELEMPDWVDTQLIHKHSSARTGITLSDINNIVIHYVGNPGSSAQNNRDYFNKSSTDVSSHFIIGLEGEIIQCLPLYEKSAASNNRNFDTISIEVCHPDQSGKFNNATYNSLLKLSAFLCNKLGLDENDIIRHYDITKKICPKYYVEHPTEWKNFKTDVKERLDSYEEGNQTHK